MPTTLSGGGAIVLPTRAGYTFGGYEYSGMMYYDADGASTHSWDRASNTTLTAIWTTNTPTIAVASVDHVTISATTPSISEGNSKTHAYGSTVTLSHGDPTSGYLWAGWNVYKTGDPSTKVTVTNNQFSMPDFDVTVSANLYSDLKAWCMTFEIADQAGTGDADIHLTSAYGVKVYATIVQRLTSLMNVWGEYEAAQQIVLPAIEKLEKLGCDSTGDYANLLLYEGCYQNRFGISEAKANEYLAQGYRMHLDLIQRHPYFVYYRDAVIGLGIVCNFFLDIHKCRWCPACSPAWRASTCMPR